VQPATLTWTAAMLAWILAVPLYYVAKFLATVAHEGGHALVAKLLFRKLESITFKRDSSGRTSYASALPWLVAIPTAMAGYLGPSMFGLLAAYLLGKGATGTVLWASLAFLLVMLIAVRGVVGWVVVPVLMAAIFAITMGVHPPVQTMLTYMWVWFLLIVPVEDMLVFMRAELWKDAGSDSAKLQKLTLLPSALWGVLLLAGTIAALVYGGAMLLRLHA